MPACLRLGVWHLLRRTMGSQSHARSFALRSKTTGYSVGSASGDVTFANFAPGGVTCAAGYTGTGSYTVCRSAGTAHSVSACQATCTVPTTAGYSIGSASGDVTIANLAPGVVTCAAGYTEIVSFTVCGSAGTTYSVSTCLAACTVPATKPYSSGSLGLRRRAKTD